MTTSIITTRRPPPAPRPNRRGRALDTEAAFDVLARARALEARGRSVVHLEIGEPGVPTPAPVVAAGILALRRGRTGYAPPAGELSLREAVAADLVTRGVDARPDRVVITPGAKPALFLALHLLLEPGDEALVPDPGFPIYPSAIRAAGGRPVSYTLDTGDGFALDPDRIAARLSRKTRLLVLNLPHNPTGAVATPPALEAVATLVRRHRLTVLTDDVYAAFRYDGGAPSIAALPGMADRTVVVDSFSKRFAMTGWRLGYAHLPPALVDPFIRYVVNAFSCVPPFVQAAGIAALSGPRSWTAELQREFSRRRTLLTDGLNAIPGLRCTPPDGAFYAFARTPPHLPDFAGRLLESEGVAVLDGAGFGPGGAGHVRISFAPAEAILAEALVRIRRFVKEAA